MISDRTSSAFFEAKYKEREDPWEFASSPDELFRYDRTLNAINHRRYRRAFEPACSVGVLTARLAGICERVSAFDVSETAASRAAERCAGMVNVEVRCASLADTLPARDVDLLLLSEVGYYFEAEDWERLLNTLLSCVQRGCTVLAVHWLGSSEDHCMSGDEVHSLLRAHHSLQLEHEERYPNFRLDRFVRV